MKLLVNTLVILLFVFGCCGGLQAQDLTITETTHEKLDVRLPLSRDFFESGMREALLSSDRFTTKQDKPADSIPSNTPDPYVFPDSRKRFHRYVKNTIGPLSLLKSAAAAGLNQWDNHPLEWGQGAEGYGKRLASHISGNTIRQTVTYGLSEALHLDTGFERSKRHGFWPRLKDALVQNVTSRTRSGKRIISPPIFAGAYAGSIIPEETWYPSRYSYKDGLRSGTYSLASGFALNAIREFFFNW
jgi:hypothetical protein